MNCYPFLFVYTNSAGFWTGDAFKVNRKTLGGSVTVFNNCLKKIEHKVMKLIVEIVNHDWMDDRHMGDKLIHSTTALNSSSSSSRFE